MNPTDFKSERSGQIVIYEDDNGEKVVTFEPKSLPPDIDYDEEMVRLVEEAASNLNDLKGTGRNLPNPNIFIQPYILKEAVLSSQIEGTRTSFEEAIIQADREEEDTPEKRDLQEVRNYANALEYGIERLGKEPLTSDLIRRVHQKLMSGVRGEDRSPGEFRDKQVHIGEVGVPREDAEFVPMQPEGIEERMQELEEFINTNHSMPYLIKSALIHYHFETIHPFEDGNGRIGRLLVILDMLDKDKLTQPLLYLSEYFNNNKGRYYDKLQNVREEGDYEEWTKFFLRAVKNQSQKSTEMAVKILDKKEDYINRMREEEVPDKCILLMENMFDLKTRTISGVAEELGVNYYTARGYLKALEEGDIAKELDRDGKEKHYILGEILELMAEESNKVIQN